MSDPILHPCTNLGPYKAWHILLLTGGNAWLYLRLQPSNAVLSALFATWKMNSERCDSVPCSLPELLNRLYMFIRDRLS